MDKLYRYETDKNGDYVLFHDKTKTWFAYARSIFRDEVVRGKGKTKEDAVKNSISNTYEDRK